MTDEQIIKAKEHYTYGITHDIFKEPVLSYAKTVLWAFDEINRQKEEINILKEKDNKWAISYMNAVARVVSAKFEAYNELAYKLKQCCSDLDTDNINEPNVRILWDAEKIIDDVVEEIMEDN